MPDTPIEPVYRQRADAWAARQMLEHPDDYRKALACWDRWQRDPVRLEGGTTWQRASTLTRATSGQVN